MRKWITINSMCNRTRVQCIYEKEPTIWLMLKTKLNRCASMNFSSSIKFIVANETNKIVVNYGFCCKKIDFYGTNYLVGQTNDIRLIVVISIQIEKPPHYFEFVETCNKVCWNDLLSSQSVEKKTKQMCDGVNLLLRRTFNSWTGL